MDKSCGLDVHKDSLFACILDEEGEKDVKDAHRIAQCLQKELIRGRFVPDAVLQQMRQLTR